MGSTADNILADWREIILCLEGIESQLKNVNIVADVITAAACAGNVIFACGNGGSAAMAQHLAAELAIRFESERRGFPCIALTSDSSVTSAAANDFGWDQVFSRQLQSLGRKSDVLLGFSTSGDSQNVINAIHTAREMGLVTVGFSKMSAESFLEECDFGLGAPSSRTARIQEIHLAYIHLICSVFDETMRSSEV